MTAIKSEDYLPRKHKNEELFKWLCGYTDDDGNHVPGALDKALEDYEDAYSHIRDKFRDPDGVDDVISKEVIKEMGYQYIVDILELTATEIRKLRANINLIHFLKGGKEGLTRVFDYLDVEATTEEWWETDPQGTPDTFTMTLTGGNISQEVVDAIKVFVRNYVYPILEEIYIEYIVEEDLFIQAKSVGEAWVFVENYFKSVGNVYFGGASIPECMAMASNIPEDSDYFNTIKPQFWFDM